MNTLLNQDELCQYLRISKSSLWRLRTYHHLPYVLIGSSLRYQIAEIERWIEKQTSEQRGNEVDEKNYLDITKKRLS